MGRFPETQAVEWYEFDHFTCRTDMATTVPRKPVQSRPFTVADFDALPDDGNHYEIIGGVLGMSPAPELDHRVVQARLLALFQNDLDLGDRGVVFGAPTDVQFSQFDIVEPDIVVVLEDNFDILRGKRIVGTPDLIVEIISPSSAGRDRVRKAALFALHGVREYWLVDPKEKAIVVQILENGVFVPVAQPAGIVRSVILAGVEVSLDRLFRPLGPSASVTGVIE